MSGKVAIRLSTSPATSSGTRWTFSGVPMSALSGQSQSGSVRARDAASFEQRGLLRAVPNATVAVQVLAYVREPDGGVSGQLVLQRDVDLVDIFRCQCGVDRRPFGAEFHTGGALLVQLVAQLVRAVVDPVGVRIKEGVPDPRRARRIGTLVRVGQIQVVAAEMSLEHGALGRRE